MTLELFTRVSGDPGRPTVILVHGSGQGARMWRRQLVALSDRFHVVALDLPGFGRSPGPFTMARAVAAVTQLAQRHTPAHLCGISLGSMVAAKVAAEHPDLLARLILAGPVIAPARSGPHLLRRYRRWPGWLVRTITDVPDRPGWLDVLNEVASRSRVTGPGEVIGCSRIADSCGHR